jgi:hypothetical protein
MLRVARSLVHSFEAAEGVVQDTWPRSSSRLRGAGERGRARGDPDRHDQ